MNITVIGAGNVGKALATGWANKGHQVTFGARNPNSEKVKAATAAPGSKAKVASVKDAVAHAEIVVFATPWAATLDAVKEAGDLAGKVVVDCTNPIKPDRSGSALPDSSAAEEIAKAAKGAKVVKAFNTTGSGNMANPKYPGGAASGFLCGDDAGAKATVAKLAEDLGFEAVDCGGVQNARLLESLARLWIGLAYGEKKGPDIAFRLIRR